MNRTGPLIVFLSISGLLILSGIWLSIRHTPNAEVLFQEPSPPDLPRPEQISQYPAVYRFRDGGTTCYVVWSGGAGISCVQAHTGVKGGKP